MTVTLTWQSITAAAAAIAAIIGIVKYYNRGYDFVKRQQKQDEAIEEIREEQVLLTYGVLACLKGLKEQGCNGPVTDAIDRIEKYLNKKAHGQSERKAG